MFISVIIFTLRARRIPCGMRGLKCETLDNYEQVFCRIPCGMRGLKSTMRKNLYPTAMVAFPAECVD